MECMNGHMLTEGENFCGICGSGPVQTISEDQTPGRTQFCTQCGADKDGNLFCTQCGHATSADDSKIGSVIIIEREYSILASAGSPPLQVKVGGTAIGSLKNGEVKELDLDSACIVTVEIPFSPLQRRLGYVKKAVETGKDIFGTATRISLPVGNGVKAYAVVSYTIKDGLITKSFTTQPR